MPQLKDVEKLSYEQALQELQKIVELLDEGQQPLDETVKLFERGQTLARHCETLLNSAQLKVTRVSSNADNSLEGKDD